jgi:hypothetical protein
MVVPGMLADELGDGLSVERRSLNTGGEAKEACNDK